MTYVLDTNFFIDANRLHLPIEQHPAFWNWLVKLADGGNIAIPQKVYDELMTGDELEKWTIAHKEKLVNRNIAYTQIRRVMKDGYGSIDEVTIEKLGADPFVIAHALAVNGTVVTGEKFGKHTAPHNKKIPSVCQVLRVPYMTITAFMWVMKSK